MPWKKVSIMEQRKEFLAFARQPGANRAELCRRFGLSRNTAYRLLARADAGGPDALAELSRRPHHCPGQTPQAVETHILAVRDAHPAWGARKLHVYLSRESGLVLPAPSTITAILRRNLRLPPLAEAPQRPYKRFERDAPNDLWQMDFKGHFKLREGRCHPLTLLDDHSRFNLCLDACADETATTVKACLTKLFRRYGLPNQILCDNGSPWGCGLQRHTVISVWLLHLGIHVTHGRPSHPQTQGKEERFHKTLKAEVLRDRLFDDGPHCQRVFEAWRDVYNLERPHEALGGAVPASRYQPSPRAFPEVLPPLEYSPGDLVRKVQDRGLVKFKGLDFWLSKAFHGYPIALRPQNIDGCFWVYFGRFKIGRLDLKQPGLVLDPESQHAK